MKKVFLTAALGLVSVLSLASCRSNNNSKSDLPDTSSRETETYINYIQNKITFSQTAINASDIEGASGAHYEVYLPENISEAYRLNVLDVSKYNSDKEKVSVRYGTLENSWGQSQINSVIDILVKDESLNVQTTYSMDLEKPEGYFDTEASTRRACVLYLPVQVNYVGNKKQSSDVYSYMFAPVYSVLTNLVDNKLTDAKAQEYNQESKLIKF